MDQEDANILLNCEAGILKTFGGLIEKVKGYSSALLLRSV